MNTNPKSGRLYPGEMHALEMSGPYAGSSYNFMGPGTQVHKRLARGDVPINDDDEAAMIHDLAYSEQMSPSQEIDADLALCRQLLPSKRPEALIALLAILGKARLQALGKLEYGVYSKRTASKKMTELNARIASTH